MEERPDKVEGRQENVEGRPEKVEERPDKVEERLTQCALEGCGFRPRLASRLQMYAHYGMEHYR